MVSFCRFIPPKLGDGVDLDLIAFPFCLLELHLVWDVFSAGFAMFGHVCPCVLAFLILHADWDMNHEVGLVFQLLLDLEVRKSFIYVTVVFMAMCCRKTMFNLLRIGCVLAFTPQLWRQGLAWPPLNSSRVHLCFPMLSPFLHFSNLERLRTDIEVIFYDDLSKQAVAYRCSVGLCQKKRNEERSFECSSYQWMDPTWCTFCCFFLVGQVGCGYGDIPCDVSKIDSCNWGQMSLLLRRPPGREAYPGPCTESKWKFATWSDDIWGSPDMFIDIVGPKVCSYCLLRLVTFWS